MAGERPRLGGERVIGEVDGGLPGALLVWASHSDEPPEAVIRVGDTLAVAVGGRRNLGKFEIVRYRRTVAELIDDAFHVHAHHRVVGVVEGRTLAVKVGRTDQA